MSYWWLHRWWLAADSLLISRGGHRGGDWHCTDSRSVLQRITSRKKNVKLIYDRVFWEGRKNHLLTCRKWPFFPPSLFSHEEAEWCCVHCPSTNPLSVVHGCSAKTRTVPTDAHLPSCLSTEGLVIFNNMSPVCLAGGAPERHKHRVSASPVSLCCGYYRVPFPNRTESYAALWFVSVFATLMPFRPPALKTVVSFYRAFAFHPTGYAPWLCCDTRLYLTRKQQGNQAMRWRLGGLFVDTFGFSVSLRVISD